MANFKPSICGSNNLHMPESDCGDCDELAVRVNRLEECCADVQRTLEENIGRIRALEDYRSTAEETISEMQEAIEEIQDEVGGRFVGVTNTSIWQGVDFNPMAGVTAYNKKGNSVPFMTIPSSIDTCEVGAHTITYTASGVGTAVRTVTVTQSANPTINGTSTPLNATVGEDFDPMEGITAVDGNGNNITSSVTVDATEAYAYLDTSDNSLHFFRDDIGAYTNGQVEGTKTYYTGLEDADFDARQAWGSHSGIYDCTTVQFDDVIKPITCEFWFADIPATSINNIERLDTSNVTNMGYMFYNSGFTALDIGGWDVSNVTSMYRMFDDQYAITTLDLSGWDTSNVTNMCDMFGMAYNTSSLVSINMSGWDTSNVTDMSGMFDSREALETLDLGDFDTSNVTRMAFMFYNCSNLKTIYVSDSFSTEAISHEDDYGPGTDGSYWMFKGCTSLVGGAGTVYDSNHIDKAYAHIDGGVSNPGYFTQKPTS